MIQVAQQQGRRLAAAGTVRQQLRTTRHECATVADAGQRVGIGGSLEFQLGAFAHHGQGDIGDADGVEHRFEQQESEKNRAVASAGKRMLQGYALVGEAAHGVKASVRQGQ
ncbi:hypothetical protein D3C84_706400 [compost metagenome]